VASQVQEGNRTAGKGSETGYKASVWLAIMFHTSHDYGR